MSTPRRRGREIALQMLFVLDADPNMSAQTAIALYFHHLAEGEEEGLPGKDEPADHEYAKALVTDVAAHREQIDQDLATVSRNWRVERMAKVDRNVLRLALCELQHRPDIPARVTLNEAIELAKRFGSAEAPGFVNGILDAAVKAFDVKK